MPQFSSSNGTEHKIHIEMGPAKKSASIPRHKIEKQKRVKKSRKMAQKKKVSINYHFIEPYKIYRHKLAENATAFVGEGGKYLQ